MEIVRIVTQIGENGVLVSLDVYLPNVLSHAVAYDAVQRMASAMQPSPAKPEAHPAELQVDSPEYGAGANLPAAAEPSRRRRGNALGEPETKPEAPAPTEGRRRRGGLEIVAQTGVSAEASGLTPETPAPAEGRRRRRREGQSDAPLASAVTEPLSTTSASPAPTSPEQPSRRRRSAAPAEPAPGAGVAPPASTSAPSSPASDISDADLSKAASEAARVLTPTVVRAYLDEFGVETTGKLKGEQRREFIDGLKAKLAEEGAK